MQFSGFYICSGCKPLAVAKISRGEAAGTIWRDDNRLVVLRNGAFPDRCIRCNGAAHGSGVRRTYYWHHPALYILVFLMLLLYVLVAILVRKQSKVYVPLCERHRKRRTMGIAISSAVLVAGLAGAFGGFAMLLSANGMGHLVVYVSLAAFFAGVIGAAITMRLLQPVRITETHAFYTGAGSAFLEPLPKWPGV